MKLVSKKYLLPFILITRYGYRRGVVTGLLLFGCGSLLFIPGANLMSFPIFLGALFIIGCGLVMLETSANPYATELGAEETAPSRLNLAQSFNGLGCIMAPVIAGGFLFSEGNGSKSAEDMRSDDCSRSFSGSDKRGEFLPCRDISSYLSTL